MVRRHLAVARRAGVTIVGPVRAWLRVHAAALRVAVLHVLWWRRVWRILPVCIGWARLGDGGISAAAAITACCWMVLT